MPPFSGDVVELYNKTSFSRRGAVDDDDDSPPSSPSSVTQKIYRTFRRSLFLGNFERCPGAQTHIEDPASPIRKQVTFDLDNNETHEVLHAKDYSDLERSLTWFNMEELKQMKADSRLVVQAWQSGARGHYMRGLEAKQFEAYRMKRKRNKADIRFAVMTEQSKQKFATGGEITDPVRLAMVSMDCSEMSRIEAQQVGLADQQAAVCDIVDKCNDEARAELMGIDCTGLILLAQSAYAY